jgi:hypothetical protein
MQVTLGDYVAAILGLVGDQFSWRLDPRVVRAIRVPLLSKV